MKYLSLLTFTAVLLLPYISKSQKTPLTDEEKKAAAAVSDKENATGAFAPFGASTLPKFFSNLSLSSFFKEGVNGKLDLQAKLSKNWSGGISLDQKIAKSAEEATPLSLTGISPGTTVKFNLSIMRWEPEFKELTNADIDDLNDEMKEMAKIDPSVKDWRNLSINDMYQNGNPAQKQLAEEWIRHRISSKAPVSLNLEAGFTKTSFKYTTDSFALTPTKESFITPTVTLSLVKALGSIKAGKGYRITGYVALSYNYSESYTAADDISFLSHFGTSSNLYSKTLSFGKPEKQTDNSIILEARKNIFIDNNKGSIFNIAIAPIATVDLSAKQASLFLPVYFIRGKDDKDKPIEGLQGGIRFGYITSTESGMISSFKDGFTAQLIITEPLDFLKKLGL